MAKLLKNPRQSANKKQANKSPFGNTANHWFISMQGKLIVVLILIILVLTMLIYMPALRHLYRADHWWWVADTCTVKNNFFDLFAHTYSYNRQREMAPGDYQLFRPLLFGFLSMKQAIFGHDFRAHQLINLLLYALSCVTVFLSMLCLISKNQYCADNSKTNLTLPALLYCLFAACYLIAHPMNYELAVWGHIGGYIIAYCLIFSTISLVLYSFQSDPIRWGNLWISVLLMTVACFFYELSQAACFLLTCALIVSGGKKQTRGGLIRALLFLIPIIVYQIINRFDYNHRILPSANDTIATVWEIPEIGIGRVTATAWEIFYWLVIRPFSFYPGELSTYPLGRTIVTSFPAKFSDYIFMAIALLSSVIGVVTLWRNGRRGRFSAVLVLGLLFISPAALTLRTLVHPEGKDLVFMSSYYAFLPMSAMFMLGAAGFCMRNGLFKRLSRPLLIIYSGMVLISTLPNAIKTHFSADFTARQSAPLYNRLSSINKFISSEPEYKRSYAFIPKNIPTLNGLPISTLLWGRYENPESYQRILDINTIDPQPFENYEAMLSKIPKIVVPGDKVHLWKHEGKYYLIEHLDGYPLLGIHFFRHNAITKYSDAKSAFRNRNKISAYKQ